MTYKHWCAIRGIKTAADAKAEKKVKEVHASEMKLGTFHNEWSDYHKDWNTVQDAIIKNTLKFKDRIVVLPKGVNIESIGPIEGKPRWLVSSIDKEAEVKDFKPFTKEDIKAAFVCANKAHLEPHSLMVSSNQYEIVNGITGLSVCTQSGNEDDSIIRIFDILGRTYTWKRPDKEAEMKEEKSSIKISVAGAVECSAGLKRKDVLPFVGKVCKVYEGEPRMCRECGDRMLPQEAAVSKGDGHNGWEKIYTCTACGYIDEVPEKEYWKGLLGLHKVDNLVAVSGKSGVWPKEPLLVENLRRIEVVYSAKSIETYNYFDKRKWFSELIENLPSDDRYKAMENGKTHREIYEEELMRDTERCPICGLSKLENFINCEDCEAADIPFEIYELAVGVRGEWDEETDSLSLRWCRSTWRNHPAVEKRFASLKKDKKMEKKSSESPCNISYQDVCTDDPGVYAGVYVGEDRGEDKPSAGLPLTLVLTRILADAVKRQSKCGDIQHFLLPSDVYRHWEEITDDKTFYDYEVLYDHLLSPGVIEVFFEDDPYPRAYDSFDGTYLGISCGEDGCSEQPKPKTEETYSATFVLPPDSKGRMKRVKIPPPNPDEGWKMVESRGAGWPTMYVTFARRHMYQIKSVNRKFDLVFNHHEGELIAAEYVDLMEDRLARCVSWKKWEREVPPESQPVPERETVYYKGEWPNRHPRRVIQEKKK